MRKILIIGPSVSRSKGGMSTVIGEIIEDNELKYKETRKKSNITYSWC